MGGGAGGGLDFGASWGSGRLPLTGMEPETIPQPNLQIGRSLGAKALNYDVKDPRSGRSYRFLEGSTIGNVEVFAGEGRQEQAEPESCPRSQRADGR